MCGIGGIFGLEGLADPVQTIHRMGDAMQHRGPDAKGHYVDDTVALCHRRLKIIDLSSAADQPVTSTDGRYVLIFNGEIYNFRELAATLGLDAALVTSDTHVLLAAYQQWGGDMLHRLNGMFALAIWDTEEQELFIARDRLGIKPLYYYRDDDRLIFASEVRALLASDRVPRKLDREALVDHLRYQTVHAPRTIVEDVSMLLPGHYMIITDQAVRTHRYWDPVNDVDRSAQTMTRGEVENEVREKLTKAVERRLVADVPFGAFLSGGIDSSAVVGLMSQVSSDPVHTFSVTFDEAEFSEAKYARMVAEKFNTEHTEIRLKPRDFLDLVPDALAAMDHPSGDGPNTYVVSKVTREAGITMALSGLGGDELFAGYPVFARTHDLAQKQWLLSFPIGLRRVLGAALRTLKPSVQSDKKAQLILQRSFAVQHSFPFSRLSLMDPQIKRLLELDDLPQNAVGVSLTELIRDEKGYELPLLSQVSVAEITTYMQNTLLRDTDQMSMAHALEVRVPFLDHELVSFVLGVSDRMKYPTTPKQLLVSALGDLLPPEIVNRPKMGFTLPWERWMKEDLQDFCQNRLRALGQRSMFNAQEIERLWQQFMSGRLNWARLWYLVVLEDQLQRLELE